MSKKTKNEISPSDKKKNPKGNNIIFTIKRFDTESKFFFTEIPKDK